MSDGRSFSDVISAAEGVRGVREDFLIELAKSENQLAAWYASKAIGVLRVSEGIPALLNNLAKPAERLGKNQTDVRLISAWSLGNFPFEEVGDLLFLALESENDLLREGAADAFGELGDPRPITRLLELVRDDVWNVAKWAALSLAKIGEKSRFSIENALMEVEQESRKRLLQDALNKLDSEMDNAQERNW